MNRRGVTLLELLLAIALLLALGALVVVPLLDRMNERAFESSADIVTTQLLLARAHAQATGEPVEVRYESAPPWIAARIFDPLLGGDDDELAETLRIPEGWAERGLVDGVRLTDRPDVLESLGPDESQQETPQTIRLAVFMPDGSALLGRTTWIIDDDGRLGRLDVNGWTGLPAFERVTADAEASRVGELEEQQQQLQDERDQEEPEFLPDEEPEP
jgi:type II secretory pathway pseudopilin PulG